MTNNILKYIKSYAKREKAIEVVFKGPQISG
jgi:hypothetical protein